MLPGVYGFSWSASNVIFLGVFYGVISLMICTIAIAAYRAQGDFKSRKDSVVRWEADFEDLTVAARACRHELAGEVKRRTCDNGFECGSCPTHAKLLQRRANSPAAGSAAAGSGPIFGLQAPGDCLYHRGHAWVRLECDGTATVGLDDFGTRLIGEPERVILPGIGTVLRLHSGGWQIQKSGFLIKILSPLYGEVIETGGLDQGWYLRLKPSGDGFDTQHLLQGPEIRPWLLRESERLQDALAADGMGQCLADGGELVKDVPSAYPDADWEAIWGNLFLEP